MLLQSESFNFFKKLCIDLDGMAAQKLFQYC